MIDFKIEDMDLIPDKEQINNWHIQFAGTEELAAIDHYILEDNILYNLGEVIETNFEIIPIGNNEIKKALEGTDSVAIKTASDALQQKFYDLSTKMYQQANPQGAQGAEGFNGAQGDANGFDGDYTVVDDDK